MASLPKIIAVVGATASGKTDLGLELARAFSGEVLAVDSRTVYRGMDIGTAKPEGGWQTSTAKKGDISGLFQEGRAFTVGGIPHWGVDIAEPSEDYSVAEFVAYADRTIAGILSRGHVPVLVGGTGLWFDAVIDRLAIPDVPPDETLRRSLDEQTEDDLFARYAALDPEGAEVIDRYNKRRLIRAIEVCEKTGKPFSTLRTRGEPAYDAFWIGLEVPRAALNERIDARVEAMVASGLVDEVRRLREEVGCEVPAMSGIGYRQLCLFLDGHIKLKDAVELTKRDTRQYAKRQMTWFKRNDRIHWVKKPEDGVRLVQEWLSERA